MVLVDLSNAKDEKPPTIGWESVQVTVENETTYGVASVDEQLLHDFQVALIVAVLVFGEHHILPDEEKRLPFFKIKNKGIEGEPGLVRALLAGPCRLDADLLAQECTLLTRRESLVEVGEQLAGSAVISFK